MGLLGNGWDDPKSEAVMALAGGLLHGNFGRGAIGYAKVLAGAKDRELKRKFLDMQMQAQQMQLESAQRGQADRERVDGAIRNQFTPMDAQGALAGGGGPTIANAQKIGQMPAVDPLRALREGGPQAFEQVMKINSALNPKPEGPIKLGKNDRLLEPVTFRELVPSVQDPEKEPEVIRQLKFIYGDGTPAYRAALQKLGSKVTSHQPATSLTVNTPFETAFNKASGGNFAEMYGGINQQGFRAPAQMRNLERIEQLLEGVDGGRLAPTGMELASIANSFGVKLDPKLGNKQAAESLTREMALAMREPGTGPMTDKDFNNFMDIVPGLSKTAEGRKQIMTTMKNKHARDIKISKMARDYVKQHGKLDEGFLDTAADFMAQNPVVATPKGYRVQRLP